MESRTIVVASNESSSIINFDERIVGSRLDFEPRGDGSLERINSEGRCAGVGVESDRMDDEFSGGFDFDEKQGFNEFVRDVFTPSRPPAPDIRPAVVRVTVVVTGFAPAIARISRGFAKRRREFRVPQRRRGFFFSILGRFPPAARPKDLALLLSSKSAATIRAG